MKIYNEIIIDMNPESSSYGETLHEDSFEYHGEMMLMQSSILGQGDTDKAKQLAAKLRSRYGIFGGEYWYYADGRGWIRPDESDPAFTTDYYKEGDSSHTRVEQYTYDVTDMEGTSSTWSADFDPTSGEFQASVERTGGFDELALLHGQDPKDFDEFYGAPLDYLKQQYGAGGTQQQKSVLAYDTAKGDYTSGLSDLGMKTGTNLADIYSQTEKAYGISGLESSGTIGFTGKKATKGVFQEYKAQQRELARSKASAKSMFDIVEQERRDTLGYETADFWKTTEDQFYTELGENESDRKLKYDITKVGNSQSGIPIYTFRYKNIDTYGNNLYRGVMSDEVPKYAVRKDNLGYDLVDYSKIDVKFERRNKDGI